MLTIEQIKQVEYNDRAVKNFKRNKAIKISLEEKQRERIKQRRIELEQKAREDYLNRPKTFTLSNRSIVLEQDLTEEIIDKEIALGFEQRMSVEII